MEYIELTSEGQLQNLYNMSNVQTVVVFKHSTRCLVSAGVAGEMDNLIKKPPENTVFARVLVVENRPVSLKIEEDLGVRHESPQVIMLRNKKVIFHTSHRDITEEKVKNEINKV